jgi:hypothetical protein
MVHKFRSWGRIAWFVLRGMLAGYVAYIPFLAVTEYVLFGRVDEERFFYGLFNPLLFPHLAWPPLWKAIGEIEGSADIFLICAGDVLLIAGAIFSVWLGSRGEENRNAIRGLGL